MTLCIPTDGLTLNISPAPIAPTHRTSAVNVMPGMRLWHADAMRLVTRREWAVDRTLDFELAGGGACNLHPYRRVTVA
jgi:hypothetical protein